jgi:hypothetical protein
VARVAIESQAAPAAQGPLESKMQDLAVLIFVVCATAALLDPGVMLGAVFGYAWRWSRRPPLAHRLGMAALLLVPLLVLRSFVVPAWPWYGLCSQTLVPNLAPVGALQALRSFFVEAFAGPAAMEAVLFALSIRQRSVTAQIRRDHRLDQQRWNAISEQPKTSFALLPQAVTPSPEHPAGFIRIGYDLETGQAVDLAIPTDLATHVFLPGLTGMGKTTTVARLVDGALVNGYGVVIVDCKAGGLGNTMSALAGRHYVPFARVDPDDPHSLGYDPCVGDAAAVANKLVGTFSFGPNAEIYKNIAMESVAVAVRGLQAAGEAITLPALYRTFAPEGFANLALRVPAGDPVRDRLLDLQPSKADRTGAAGLAGLQRRLGALLEGKFGWLLTAPSALDWQEVTARPAVTYVALSALASSEDIGLMGRVIVQDLKQLCAQRLRMLAAGRVVRPILVVLDEAAALDEPEQLLDLLRQSREARMSIVISTQHTPDTPALRKACFGAGLLIVHRVEAEDSELLAAQFGTRRATEVTHQVDYETGFSQQGSIRRVDKYNVNPNELRELAVGQTVIKRVASRRYAIVRIFDHHQASPHPAPPLRQVPRPPNLRSGRG